VTAGATATVVWLAPDPPDDADTRSLAAWARAHGVVLAPPSDEAPRPIPVDVHALDPIDDWLDRARDAMAAQDGATADRELAAAEALLRVHPELPQAAWLMAEVERARAARFWHVDPPDPEAADRAWTRAEALDGGRLPGLGEHPSGQAPRAAQVRVDLPAGAGLRVDGSDRSRSFASLAGPHAVVVRWNDTPVAAAWVELPAGDSTLTPWTPAAPPCSVSDARQATTGPEGVASARVSCPNWVAVTVGPRPGSLRVAVCAAARCGETVDWSPPAPPEPVAWARVPPPTTERRASHAWPAWATWTLVGAGVAVAAGVAAGTVASGAFSSAPSATRYVTGGVVRMP
jgi:hypothetical protein